MNETLKEKIIKQLDALHVQQIKFVNALTDSIEMIESYVLELKKEDPTKSFEEVAREHNLYDVLEEMCDNLSELNGNQLTSYLLDDWLAKPIKGDEHVWENQK